jgi:hypothetical protein
MILKYYILQSEKKETYNSKNTCGVIEEINFAIFVVGVMVNKKVTI